MTGQAAANIYAVAIGEDITATFDINAPVLPPTAEGGVLGVGIEGEEEKESLFHTITDGWDLTSFLVMLILVEHGMLIIKIVID